MENLPEIENHRHSKITAAFFQDSPTHQLQQYLIPSNVKKVSDRPTRIFLESIASEEHQVKQFHEKELQSTAENPFVKLQDNLHNITEKLGSQKKEALSIEKNRQKLRQNNTELRLLLRQIKNAKILHSQIKYRENVDSKKIPAYVAKRNQVVENIEYMNKVAELEKAERDDMLKKKFDLRQSLLKQIEEKQNFRNEEYQLKLKEREHMRTMMRHLQEQDRYEQMEEKIQQKEDYDRILRFKNIRNIVKKQKYERENHAPLLDILGVREQYVEKLRAEKKALRQKRDVLSNAIGEQLRLAYVEKEQRQNLLQDLLVEERKANEDKRYRKRLEEEMEMRHKTQLEMQKFEKLKETNKKIKAQEHKKIATEKQITMVDIMAENEKIAHQLQEERRRQYRIDINQQLKENRHHREGELLLKKKIEKDCSDLQQKFENDIEMERMYLLGNQPDSILQQLQVKNIELMKKRKYLNDQKLPLKAKGSKILKLL
ncbi:golgin subfamily A member 6-like protein 22 [Teleopsis dalmanni]|uniref:golgin subfamily A member 6-like protein 22 n=1 Tax=Teleopsis dalmanni TaxID=139649 RepID=UPI0018CDE8F4|nr:golgin subfamily A member 6-like protein 22 [Teleopsis dalmanni]